MMTLDERARSAAGAVRAAVESAHPVAPAFPPATFGPVWLRPALSFAMAAVVVAAVALIVSRPGPQVADIPEPTEPVITVQTVPDTTISTAPEAVEPAPVGPTPEADAGAPTPPPVDVTPPEIAILEPADGARFTDSRVRFSGTTEPGATVAVGPFEADVDEQGNWTIVLVLAEGGNRATVVATDDAGNTGEDSVVVYLDPPATTATTKPPPEEEPPPEEPPAVVFHAEQLYGNCAEEPPYDVFFGTGVPGHIVKVASDYGSGETTIREDGSFEIQVFFPTAPVEVTFAVTVKDKSTGESFVFEFVYTG